MFLIGEFSPIDQWFRSFRVARPVVYPPALRRSSQQLKHSVKRYAGSTSIRTRRDKQKSCRTSEARQQDYCHVERTQVKAC